MVTHVLLVGLCTVDVVQRVDEIPGPGEKVQARAVDLAAGGPAANAAVAVATLGGRPTLVTSLGTHPLAELARADLHACGVRVVDLTPTRVEPPPVSAVLVREHDGERSVVSRSAADIVAPPAPDLLADLVDDAGAVLLDGHHPAPTMSAARAARRAGVPVVLDAGSWKPVLDELLPLVDVCACSGVFTVPDDDDVFAGLHRRGVPVVTRTNGPEPVLWSADGLRGAVPPPAVPVQDTVGAGDVWHGGLAFGVARLRRVPRATELPELVAEANRLAGIRVSYAGPRTWVEPARAALCT
ncbi:MAG TPA: PfkB family carbohydrate kinase [Pseudonocardiaceae bacterium]